MAKCERELVSVRPVPRNDRGVYMLRWKDPTTGETRTRHTKHPLTRKGKRDALSDALALQEQINSGRADAREFGWIEFEQRYTSEHLSGLAKGTRTAWTTARNHLCRIVKPATLADVDAQALSRLAATLRREGARETSIACYVRTIRAALSWAVEMELLPAAPRYRTPKRAKGVSGHMRSRPIKAEEFDRLLLAAKKVRPKDYRRWRRFLKGLYWGGLRLGEALSLTWKGGPFSVDLSGNRPVFRVLAEGEKAHRDRILPMAPELGRLLLRCPEGRRKGKVFRIPYSRKTAGRIISEIGRHARVKVSDNGKHASAHDLRRSFGTRWAARLKPAELQQLMRHKSIETTMRYYVSLDAQELAEKLWSHDKTPNCSQNSSQRHSRRSRSKEPSL